MSNARTGATGRARNANQLHPKGIAMTLHTRVMVTSPGIDSRAAFVRMRELIGAGEQYSAWDSPDPTSDNRYRHTMTPGHHMDLGQGLPALMWVDHNNGALLSRGEFHDDDCEAGCYCGPEGYVEINYDTAYGYRAENNASCGDLHAWITREIGQWLTDLGATWQWYDESGDGWTADLSNGYGALGDPEVGAPGSAVQRVDRDPMRSFGEFALAAIAAEVDA